MGESERETLEGPGERSRIGVGVPGVSSEAGGDGEKQDGGA